ncbi:hypothetical protein H6F74_05595 [Trichocoleus sp. FACHB-90]|uniref:hypothetical protein n=1 Tax=Cyanophyceae TaxID=3028117 RepID=UPI001688CE40|nr:hypothetical protein [Trichocoleus sp. FACHB-90]MBD1925756.1 hypothetical protein [Trichocoleus sp. FACHB-90]
MALINPFEYVQFAPDLADFKIPWSIVTPTDRAVMLRRYRGLNNNSYGVIRRHNYSTNLRT